MQYTVSNPLNQRQVGYAHGFVRIVEGPLYVYIAKGSFGVYIEQRNITIDGSSTYDPDFFGEKGGDACFLSWERGCIVHFFIK